MKYWTLILTMLMLTTMAQSTELHPYRVPISARETLQAMNADVDHGRLGGDFVAYLTFEQAQELEAQDYDLLALTEAEATGNPLDETDEFHNYTQMRDSFLAYAAAHPDIAQYELLGYSVQNRELFALKISDNATVEEDEPEVVLWGGIHGNEYGGAEMPYLYALYLLDNYGTDPAVTQYVNDNQIWCIPLINPDGHTNGTRNNANNVDLNRDLGYQWYGQGGSPAALSQIENRTIREFCLDHNVTLSTTFHCSGNYCLYPWGFGPQNVPDYGVTLRACQRYAAAASYTYINSWDDYETHGELLDYLYGCFGGLCITVEVSNSSSLVNDTFMRNRAGMNLFCASAGMGLHGTVIDAQTNQPLRAAVWIDTNPIPAYTHPQTGALHRIVAPGTYTVKVWANGYAPQTITGVVVTPESPGQFQAALQSSSSDYAFMVASVNQRDPNNAHANVTYPAFALNAPDGYPASLGQSGFIVLDFGAGHEIVNGPGNDFTVTEAIFNHDTQPEAYQVFAGNAYTQTTLIGSGTGTASFDLGAVGVTSTRYLKILDQSGASPNLPFAGMDLDAVTVLNSAATTAAEPITQAQIPEELTVTCSPNPFNPTTAISFKLQASSYISLKVHDTAGRLVATLVEGWREAGTNEVTFDGSKLASGIYLYRMEVSGSGPAGGLRSATPTMITGNMVLLK